MLRWILLAAGLALLPVAGRAEPEIPLWPAGAPGAAGTTAFDIPTITVYLPPKEPGPTGAALVICPGGGYARLSVPEGEGYARWLAGHGVAGFVLKYRLGSHGYHNGIPFEDATRAMRYVRAHAADWGLNKMRIGIIGSSAGGHLASTVLTHFDTGKPDDPDPIEHESSRPDLGILCYPVITMGADTHTSSRKNLLGEHPPDLLVNMMSSELHVSQETPPCFLFHTWEDPVVKVENTLLFAGALRAKGVPFDLHIYQKGGHGTALGAPWDQPEKQHPWTRDCLYWLKVQGFVN